MRQGCQKVSKGGKTMFITDNEIILNTENLQWVTKEDKLGQFGDDSHYYLAWGYEGQEFRHLYKGDNAQQDRDAAYTKIKEAIEAYQEARAGNMRLLASQIAKATREVTKHSKKDNPRS
jgi:hypothetical protein